MCIIRQVLMIMKRIKMNKYELFREALFACLPDIDYSVSHSLWKVGQQTPPIMQSGLLRNHMQNQKKAYMYGIVTVLFWSTVATAFKLSLRYLDHFQLLLYSSIVSILVMSIILILQGKISLIFSYTKRQYVRSILLGFLNPFLYYTVLFKAYDLLPAQEAQPLNYTWAITLVVLLSVQVLITLHLITCKLCAFIK